MHHPIAPSHTLFSRSTSNDKKHITVFFSLSLAAIHIIEAGRPSRLQQLS